MRRLLKWAWRTINRHWVLQILFWLAALGWGTIALLVIAGFIYRTLYTPSGSNPFVSVSKPTIADLNGYTDPVDLPYTPNATPAPLADSYTDVRQPVGILKEYMYTERVIDDNGVIRGATREQPDLNQPGQWPVTNNDTVAVLDEWTNEYGKWFKIILVSSSVDPHLNGNGGWVLSWLIDGQGVPPPPTPTLEAPTEAIPPTPAPVPTEDFQEDPPVIFHVKTQEHTGNVHDGEEKGCITGSVTLLRGPTQVTVLFQQGETYLSADVDSEGNFRKCGVSGGQWGAVVSTLGGNPFNDSNSFQAIIVTEGEVTKAIWWEQGAEEPPF